MTTPIVNLVESARHALAPIVGIPQLGQRAFCVKRELLVRSLKGLTVIEAQIAPASDSRDVNVLKLWAAASGVKATRTFYALNMENWDNLKLQHDWAQRQRKKRLAPVMPRSSAKDKYLAKLEKQLARLGKPEPYPHPLLTLLEDGRVMYQHRQDRDVREQAAYTQLIAEGNLGISHRNTVGESYVEWLRERPRRVAVTGVSAAMQPRKANHHPTLSPAGGSGLSGAEVE